MLAEQYGKPSIGGVGAGEEEEEPSLDSKYDKAFGPKSQQTKKTAQQKVDMAKEEKLRRIAELKEKAGPGKTDAEREEQKVMRVFKDKDVNMNPEGLV
jgi:hypothetical protein